MVSPLLTKLLVEAGLESQVLLHDDPKYEERAESYFDNASKLQPACFLQPRSALETAIAVKILADTHQPFAVRSGGCTVRPGSNNIDRGLTIDLSFLNSVQYNSDDTADVGPGATWDQVYDELEKHDRIAVGGRVAGVGVGGYLLGGGFSFHAGRHGLGCDNVVAYQIAVADGSLITASASENEDLFRALKGGGSNFGIVTRFTLKTFPSSKIWCSMSVKPVDMLPAAAEALANFTSRASEDQDSTMLFIAASTPSDGDASIVMLTYNAAGVENPKVFDRCMTLPSKVSQSQTNRIQEFLLVNQLSLPRNRFNVWHTLTCRNDSDFIVKASEQLFQLSEQLETQTRDFTAQIIFQPIPRLYAEKAAAAGGNVLGLELIPYDAIMMVVCVSVKTAEMDDRIRPHVKAFVDDLRASLASREGLVPWAYLNYAHDSQDVLQGYGVANVVKIREVAAKYDPEGVLQRLWKGGFKISAVGA